MATPTTPTFTPITMPTLPTPPAAPSTPVQNAANLPRESFLRDVLDPSKATYIGNKYRPELQAAGRELRSGLEAYGDYSYTEDAQGGLTPQKDTTGQPGRAYKDSYFDARSQAAAAGMLYSRTAEQAVGDAWHRLSEQERGLLNQYAGQESEILSRMASEFTGATTELTTLYGQDVQYAIDHPVIGADAAVAAGATGSSGSGGVGDDQLKRGGGGTAPGKAPGYMWKGTAAPSLRTLSKAWGVPISQLRVTHSGTGKNVVTVKG